MKKHLFTILGCALVPAFASAEVAYDVRSLIDYLFTLITGNLIPLVITLALIYVIYASVNYIRESEDAGGKSERKQQIFWGIIGLFVIITIWSLVSILANSFQIFGGGTLPVR